MSTKTTKEKKKKKTSSQKEQVEKASEEEQVQDEDASNELVEDKVTEKQVNGEQALKDEEEEVSGSGSESGSGSDSGSDSGSESGSSSGSGSGSASDAISESGSEIGSASSSSTGSIKSGSDKDDSTDEEDEEIEENSQALDNGKVESIIDDGKEEHASEESSSDDDSKSRSDSSEGEDSRNSEDGKEEEEEEEEDKASVSSGEKSGSQQGSGSGSDSDSDSGSGSGSGSDTESEIDSSQVANVKDANANRSDIEDNANDESSGSDVENSDASSSGEEEEEAGSDSEKSEHEVAENSDEESVQGKSSVSGSSVSGSESSSGSGSGSDSDSHHSDDALISDAKSDDESSSDDGDSDNESDGSSSSDSSSNSVDLEAGKTGLKHRKLGKKDEKVANSKVSKKGGSSISQVSRLKKAFGSIKLDRIRQVMSINALGFLGKDIAEIRRWRAEMTSSSGKKKKKKKKGPWMPDSTKRAALRLISILAFLIVLFAGAVISFSGSITLSKNTTPRTGEFSFDQRWITPKIDVDDLLDLIHVHEHKVPNDTKVAIKRLPGLEPPQYMNLKPSELVQIRRPAVRKMRPEDTRATRTFGCLRDGCRGLAIEDLLDRDWQMRFRAAQKGDTYKSINYRVTFLLTDTTQLNHMQKLRPDLYKAIYEDYEGKSYLTAFQGGDAIGGNKGQQLKVKENFVRKFGCKYNDLGISPMSYRLYLDDECNDLAKLEALGITWLLKPETGSQGQGITFHSEVASVMNKVPQFFPCQKKEYKATERYLVQEYLEKPLLLKKCKFDVRVYMLVASSNPFLVFYHEGYLRRALAEYSAMSKDRRVYLTNTHFQSMKKGFKLSEHLWSFTMMQDHLREHDKTGAHYVESMLNPYIKKVALLIFHSARKKFKKRKGTFHIFGIDFMIDANYHTWFIESNGYPGFTWSLNFDSRQMVEEYFNLAQQVHENPHFYTLMQTGDRYGSFEMIFNELEEERTKVVYNPCQEFKDNRAVSAPLKMANRRFSKYTGKSGSLEGFKTHVNGISGMEAFAGHKGESVKVQHEYFKESGCDARNLKYMPATYLLYDMEDCQQFFKETKGKWVLKPINAQDGEGVTIYASVAELKEDFGECGQSRKGEVIAQRFIENRLLFSNKWYDMKVFYLIATSKPYMVFYHNGYIRSSKISSLGQVRVKRTQAAKTVEVDETGESDTPVGEKKKDDDDDEAELDLGLDELVAESKEAAAESQSEGLESANQEETEGNNNADLYNEDGDDGDGPQAGEGGELPVEVEEELEPWVPESINSGDSFDLNEELISFENFEDREAKLNRFGSRYMSSIFDTYAKRVGELIYRAARRNMVKKQGNQTRTDNAYHLISANFLMDDKYNIYLTGQRRIEPENAFPTSDDFKEEKQAFLDSLAGLVLEVNDVPQAFVRMRKGDSYKNWRMVMSEIEEKQRPLVYDPCEEFRRNLMVTKSSILKNAWLHNYSQKRHAANKRELNKYIEKKWDSCKHKPTREMMASCVRNTISYRYKIYLQKENAQYQDGYVEMRIRDLYAKWEAAKKQGGGGGGGGGD